jgi:hypothetical protein
MRRHGVSPSEVGTLLAVTGWREFAGTRDSLSPSRGLNYPASFRTGLPRMRLVLSGVVGMVSS